MTTQRDIYEAVRERGYRDGWTPEQFAARQVAKLTEEAEEIADHFEVGCYEWERMMTNLRAAATWARKAFDYRPNWTFVSVIDPAGLDEEVADAGVVLSCLAEAREIDLLRLALAKARRDVERGVR